MKDTASFYDRMAPIYDARWRRYLTETLTRASRHVQGKEPFSLLDVGCGTGELIKLLIQRFPGSRFVGIDPAPRMIAEAKRKLTGKSNASFQTASAEAIPFPKGSFDWVTCLNSLHCFRDARKAIGEMARVLKEGGQLFLMDWCRDPLICRLANRWCAWFDPTHVWMYTTEELRHMLEEKGCSTQRIDRFRVPFPNGLKLWEMMACLAVKR